MNKESGDDPIAHKIQVDSRHTIDKETGTLTISDTISDEDTAKYICTAKNSEVDLPVSASAFAYVRKATIEKKAPEHAILQV